MLPVREGRTPRQWQLDALAAAMQAFREKRRTILLSAPTGTGKGDLLSGISVLSQRKGNRCILVSHTDELVLDLFDRVKLAGGDAGLVKAAAKDFTHPITVASRQTLQNCIDQAQAYNPALLLYDEAHIALDFQTALRRALSCRWLAATATPFRSAGRGETEGLGAVYEAVVYERSILDAIKAGDLCQVKAERVLLDIDLTSADLDNPDDVAARYDTDATNAAIAAHYWANRPGVPALYFCAAIAHAQHLATAFGPRAAAVWGDDPDRAEKIRAHRAGELDVLCNRDVLTVGYDDPRIAVIGLAYPMASVVRYMQIIGRGTRAGKPFCQVYDYVGTTETVQFVTWADISKAEKKALQREAKRKDAEAKERAETMGANLTGQSAYEVFLFGDEAERLGIGWYKHGKSFTCGARSFSSTLRVGLLVERDGPEWAAYVAVRSAGAPPRPPWVQGEKRSALDPGETIRCAGRFATLDLAAASVAPTFAAHNLRPTDPMATWKNEPATPKQIEGLRRWNIKRPDLSRGEAGQLLDATPMVRKVREFQRGLTQQ